MKQKTIKIKKDQYIDQIITLIPSNTIIKKPTGGGITSLAIKEKRHSIIIEANRPVIKGKAEEYNKGNTRNLKVRSVHEGITADDIKVYLESNVPHKKIITTPESYNKVLQAFEELEIRDTLYTDYFMLFDECERTIQDVDYRKSILIPMNDFFRFKHKAFVSATPITPSDPRFEQQKFTYLIIEPDYDSTQNLQLITTNNTFHSFDKYVQNTQAEQYFIFFNSTKAITTFISYLGINGESLIFCSEESRNKLKINGYNNAREHLVTSDHFAKFNFFTCRFNSAVDILNIKNPHIVIITDTFLAEHTMVDPLTEVVQIAGRFRKQKGIEITRHITHISNVSPDLPHADRSLILKDIQTFNAVHLALRNFRDTAASYVVWAVIDDMLQNSEFSKYVNPDGSTNYFMIDNAVFNNEVNGCYLSDESLFMAYSASKQFNVTHHPEDYQLTDEQKAKIKAASTLKSALELLLPVFNAIEQSGIESFESQLQLKQIEKDHPTAWSVFQSIGYDKAKELKFNYKAIKAEIEYRRQAREFANFPFLKYMKTQFKVGQSYTLQNIKTTLQTGITSFGLNRLKPTLELLERFFNISSRVYIKTDKNGKKVYGYQILSLKN